jgi:hypothetical protein
VELAEQVMEEYRSAFLRADLDALAKRFGFPLQVVSVTGDQVSITIAGSQDWPDVLKGLLETYRRLEVAEAVLLAVESFQPMDAVANIRVHWQLQRVDGAKVYDFTAVYTLARVDGSLKIIAIAHDELSKIRAAGLDARSR